MPTIILVLTRIGFVLAWGLFCFLLGAAIGEVLGHFMGSYMFGSLRYVVNGATIGGLAGLLVALIVSFRLEPATLKKGFIIGIVGLLCEFLVMTILIMT